jgi:hypothetical protein
VTGNGRVQGYLARSVLWYRCKADEQEYGLLRFSNFQDGWVADGLGFPLEGIIGMYSMVTGSVIQASK